MNLEHLRAFLWLRWRLFINQMRRAGAVNAVLTAVMAGAALLFAAFLALVFFVVGLFVLPPDPPVVMYVFDGLVVAFLFSWFLGVMIELQRSEPLSLEKFLHLPVSLTGAFFVNYLSSLLTLSMVVFLPAMLALSLALAIARGPALLILLPLIAAFFLMVTGVTHQFQSWLGSLMSNPRRRRTIIVLILMVFILMCQLPNLGTMLGVWDKLGPDTSELQRQADEEKALNADLAAGKISDEEHTRREKDLFARSQEAANRPFRQFEQAVLVANMVFPPGWMPLGGMYAAARPFGLLPALFCLLCFLGMTAVGTFSLWRSYRTTARLYTGQLNRGGGPVRSAAPVKTRKDRVGLLERRLPWVSEQASAVALGAFRSLLRAPEAKMMLLSPIILVLVFGSMLMTKSITPPVEVRPMMAVAAVGIVLVSMVQFVGNQFGFDRSGFRVYVLSAAPRRDILLGKNLAAAPIALGLSAILVAVVAAIFPMRWEHLLSVPFLAVGMYLLFCIIANGMSILSPMGIRAGSFRASNPKGTAFLIQILLTFIFPLAFAPALLPLGVEYLLERMGWSGGVPLCLILSVLECAGAVYLYRLLLTWEGRVLQAREMKVLEIVAAKAE